MSKTQLILAIFYSSSSCLLFLRCFVTEQIQMPIVEEATNFGAQYHNNFEVPTNPSALTLRVSPSSFSGPKHFESILNQCFDFIDDSYKYVFCPFSNITQHERSLRWNPYSGVLGVWHEWNIVNNTFEAMRYSDGDSCGAIYRSVKVLFQCGTENKVEKVSESETCHYELVFITPLVCHPHSMLVYPTLSKKLRDQWDSLSSKLQNDEVTEQGYEKFLREIFYSASYLVNRNTTVDSATHTDSINADETGFSRGEFSSLNQCSEEYLKLKKEVEGLRALLELNNIQISDHTTPESKNSSQKT